MDRKCNACEAAITSLRYMECKHCSAQFHIECLNVKDEQFYALPEEYRDNWTCPRCANVTKRFNRNENTPIRQSQVPSVDDTMNMSYDLADQPQSLPQSQCSTVTHNPTPSTDNTVTMNKISTLLDQKLNSTLSSFMRDFRQALKEDVKLLVRKEMQATVQQLKDDFTTTTNFICDEQLDMKQHIKQKDLVIKNLETELSNLKKDHNILNSRIMAMDRGTRSQNLEIQVVPESKTENPYGIFNNLCKTLNMVISNDQIHSCRRVAKLDSSSNRPRNLLVTLINPRLRDEVLSACHRYNKSHKSDTLNTSHLGLTCEKQKIYVTEHLSPECKALHAAARKVAKDKAYKYVWVKYGRVYIRKDDGASCILIKNEDILKKLN